MKFTDRLRFARDLGRVLHHGQKRKYTDEPYHTHPERVFKIVSKYSNVEDVGIVALGHDWLEDTDISFNQIKRYFGLFVATHIQQLTDVFTPEVYPHLNRSARKALEAQRVGNISNISKLIKLADVNDNSESIVAHDPGFAMTYIQEKSYMLELIRDGNEELYQINRQIVIDAKKKLGLT